MNGRLLDKYEELVQLREGAPGPVPRERLQDLARRFPGALAEIDRLPMDVLVGRRDALRAGEFPPFAAAWTVVHAHFRGVLALKAWLAGRKDVDDALEVAARAATLPDEAAPWLGRLREIARPPGGRLTALVHAAAAAELGVEIGAIPALLFGEEARIRPSRT